MDQFIQFPSREKDGYPNSVKSHLIIQFLGLKTGKITETLGFPDFFFIKLQNLFSVKGNNYKGPVSNANSSAFSSLFDIS